MTMDDKLKPWNSSKDRSYGFGFLIADWLRLPLWFRIAAIITTIVYAVAIASIILLQIAPSVIHAVLFDFLSSYSCDHSSNATWILPHVPSDYLLGMMYPVYGSSARWIGDLRVPHVLSAEAFKSILLESDGIYEGLSISYVTDLPMTLIPSAGVGLYTRPISSLYQEMLDPFNHWPELFSYAGDDFISLIEGPTTSAITETTAAVPYNDPSLVFDPGRPVLGVGISKYLTPQPVLVSMPQTVNHSAATLVHNAPLYSGIIYRLTPRQS